jgi:hypothetical protein
MNPEGLGKGSKRAKLRGYGHMAALERAAEVPKNSGRRSTRTARTRKRIVIYFRSRTFWSSMAVGFLDSSSTVEQLVWICFCFLTAVLTAVFGRCSGTERMQERQAAGIFHHCQHLPTPAKVKGLAAHVGEVGVQCCAVGACIDTQSFSLPASTQPQLTCHSKPACTNSAA